MATKNEQKTDPKSNVELLASHNDNLNAEKTEEELQQLLDETARLLKAKRENRKANNIALLNETCQKAGLTLADLKAFVKGYGKPARDPADVKIYQNPSNPQERWTDNGGRKPKFIRELLKSGHTLSSLEVPAPSPAEQAPLDANVNEQPATA